MRGWQSVSEWFAAMAPDVALYRERLELMRRRGDSTSPPWASDLRSP